MALSPEIPHSYLSMVNVANFVSTKLYGSNYIPWKTQIVCLLQSHDLLDFIEPEEEEKVDEMEKDEDNLQWKRTDRFVKGWILASLTNEILQNNAVHKLDTAREVWSLLKKLYSPKSQGEQHKNQLTIKHTTPTTTEISTTVITDGSSIERAESMDSEKDYSCYLPLYRASLSGDWKKAQSFFIREKEANRAKINSLLQTALHVAVGVKGEKGKHFVERLVATMKKEDLAISDSLGDTPLHYAAKFGNLHAAEILVKRNSDLPHIACSNHLYPIHHAAEYGYASADVFAYFLRVTTDRAPYTGVNGIRLLNRLIHSDLYDFARELIEENPDLAKYDSDERSALKELALKEFTFLSGSRLKFLQQLLYYCVPVRSTLRSHQRRPNANDLENTVNDPQMAKTKYEGISFRAVIKKLDAFLFDVLENLVPPLKHIRDKKSIHHNAVKYAECVCEKIETLNDKEVDSIVSCPLLDAAYYDTYELVEIIVRRFPSLAFCYDKDEKNIIHIAVERRCENVFNLICQMSPLRHQLMISLDSSGNSMLHLAGKLAPQNKLNLVSGPALQMQRELQWFKEVKKFVPPLYWESLNCENKAPYVVFTEEHEKLKADGERWMKDTSNSCTIAAALIATITFAAAITVPGGNGEQSGLPIFSGNIAFIIFAISNAASLFTSSTSLLVFLSVLTSRYAEEDFLHALPRSLILGLLTLFLSITSMMVSFSATVYLVFGQKKAWVLIPVATMACLPITSFVLLQFPLLVALISSTYGAGIFGKKSNPLF